MHRLISLLLLLCYSVVGQAVCNVDLNPGDSTSKYIDAIKCINESIKNTKPKHSNVEVLGELPSGIILPWYAKSGTVPDGWYICDGTNGTPDLRNRFLMGVSTFADVGKRGGSSTVNIDIPSHTHRFASGARKNALRAENGGGVMTHTTVVDYLINSYTRDEGGATVGIDVIPPYETVLYIMKK